MHGLSRLSAAVTALALWAGLLVPAAMARTEETAPAAAAITEPPLARMGRTLHFRGRSQLTTSQPNLKPAPQVGFLLSRLQVVAVDPDGDLTLHEDNTVYAADGETMDRLGSPRDRRTRELQVHPATARVRMGTQMTRPPEGASRRNRPLPINMTDDGFGLNAAARTAVGLASLILPAEDFAALAAGETVSRTFDFWLVRQDPRLDRVVVPATASAEPPDGAEGRVQGTTMFRPQGREPFSLLWRRPLPAAVPGGVPATSPDQRLELPALSVAVSVDLTVGRLAGAGGRRPPGLRRRDRLTWTVLHRQEEPWLLAMDGIVELEIGEGADATLREAFIARSLYQVTTTSP